MSQYKIEAATGQHIGDRKEQQDRVALFAAPKAPGYMMAVLADGMGGLTGGTIAAEQVIHTARQAFDHFSPLTDTVEGMLDSIARDAHTIINLSGISSEKQPHSTMVALVLTPQRQAVWAHVGDSRLYRFDGPNFAERTVDHSFVERMVKEGKLTREQARNHRLSNLLSNVLGPTTAKLDITMGRHDGLKPGDSFLLCSDGLWAYFEDNELGAALAARSAREASEMLVKKTRERSEGVKADNCTLAVVKLVAVEAPKKTYTAEKVRRAV
ncbi:PP2C family serine/threonine-protein phosphatase [Lacisediminimonas sp.]|uniref:PP2C family protein-serine/threonine phosphatase n=1 Tax=Lacisediminimonas sp. TaxID=3060582 RepID=UPI00272281AF|nr:protein phosphatase 2C domain-containing protein [Lacisediminimonas sp.]MDO8301273.1 protein phosphatase 2C domain-containing protein [Lacisediminimonas sp.]MDO9215697.1 protein phosphatase 2C domain-containing protein [Lacisediminimonas sp.]